MRRSDRQINDRKEILRILDECPTMRLALHDEPYPYVVPLSYGWEETDGKILLYFHCAEEGKKLELLNRNANVCAEFDELAGYRRTGHDITADYRSLIAFGRAERVYGAELVRGLELLLRHCRIEGYSVGECTTRDMTAVVRITVDSITGKRRFKNEQSCP